MASKVSGPGGVRGVVSAPSAVYIVDGVSSMTCRYHGRVNRSVFIVLRGFRGVKQRSASFALRQQADDQTDVCATQHMPSTQNTRFLCPILVFMSVLLTSLPVLDVLGLLAHVGALVLSDSTRWLCPKHQYKILVTIVQGSRVPWFLYESGT